MSLWLRHGFPSLLGGYSPFFSTLYPNPAGLDTTTKANSKKPGYQNT